MSASVSKPGINAHYMIYAKKCKETVEMTGLSKLLLILDCELFK